MQETGDRHEKKLLQFSLTFRFSVYLRSRISERGGAARVCFWKRDYPEQNLYLLPQKKIRAFDLCYRRMRGVYFFKYFCQSAGWVTVL